MSKFTLTINTDNSAFDDRDGAQEIARILQLVAADISLHVIDARGAYRDDDLTDINGNQVGNWRIK